MLGPTWKRTTATLGPLCTLHAPASIWTASKCCSMRVRSLCRPPHPSTLAPGSAQQRFHLRRLLLQRLTLFLGRG